MVDIPPKILRAYFETSLIRSSICRLDEYPFPSGQKDKYFVVLNIDCSQEFIYHALTTSQVGRYQALSFADDGILIPKGSINTFHLDTIIDCHTLPQPLKRDFLFALYCRGSLRILEQLPKTYMDQVNQIIKRSRLIAPAIKKLVLP